MCSNLVLCTFAIHLMLPEQVVQFWSGFGFLIWTSHSFVGHIFIFMLFIWIVFDFVRLLFFQFSFKYVASVSFRFNFKSKCFISLMTKSLQYTLFDELIWFWWVKMQRSNHRACIIETIKASPYSLQWTKIRTSNCSRLINRAMSNGKNFWLESIKCVHCPPNERNQRTKQ